MSQKFSTFVNMINNKSNIEMQLATYKSMLTKASNDLAKSKQLVGLLKQQIEQGNTELSEELDKANERMDTSDAEVNELGLDGLKKKISDAAGEALDEKHKEEESKASSAPEQPAVKLPKKTEKEKQESDSQLPRKRYTTTAKVLKSFGIDKSDPLMPSFCRFYLESKFAYHLSENRLLDMLSQMGMKVAQSTLNGWMQQIMTYLRERLGPVITADRAVLYETIEKDLEEMGLVRTACWFHARHRFVDAYISDHRVRVIILMMNYLFQIERESKIRKHTAKQRRRFRLKYSASIVGKLMKLLKKIKLDSSYGAMVQRAVNYVLDDEKAFKVFLQDGRVEMHNNAVERMFRHLAMGRRNWMHIGSHLGAENIAFMFSLFESCKLNDINFGDYIEDILTRLMEGEQDFMSLIPCNYNSNKKVNVKAA